jgi:hypothetical protein
MKDPKKFSISPLVIKWSGFMRGCLLIGLSMSGTLSAQRSTSHTITIRIIRPNQFSVEPAANRHQADLRRKNDEVQLNWKSDSKPKKITVSRKSDNPGSKLDLIVSGSGGNQWKPLNRMQVEAVEENLTDAITKNAGSLSMKYDFGSKAPGVSKEKNGQIFYTVMDI